MDTYTTKREKTSHVNSLSFKEFDVKKNLNEKKNFAMIVCGQRRTGKSILIRDMLKKVSKNYEHAYVFSNTILTQPELFSYIPKKNQFKGLQPDILEHIYDQQEQYIIKELSKNPKADKTKMKHILIIFDDIISDNAIRHCPRFNSLFTESRHVNIAVVALTQVISPRAGFPSVCLTNTDFIVSFFLKGKYCRESLVERFLSINDEYEGNLVFRKITNEKKYQAIVLDNTEISQNYDDIAYKYTADPKVKDYTIGKITYENRTHEPGVRISAKTGKKVKPAKFNYNIEII